MGSTPQFKVYDNENAYVAATVDAHLAAALLGAAGSDGWKVKHSGRIIWREGSEDVPASASYDFAAEVMYYRVRLHAYERGVGSAQAVAYISATVGGEPRWHAGAVR